ncbi:type III toxin-antitoxin system ToxN/AbiQ family toxin [Clostridium sp. BJN0001]|uniref:type III toxin-antitoxin system ToxN/AbiQ family toxin n=1 Tax=Clostridium sp. BJN0001 TaxID=2930219 RepID=UPI001FD09F13|nr:type III toxin-antitoxin system ToxN/AbiQ family toxin [Clostridium sp. BJN0001]
MEKLRLCKIKEEYINYLRKFDDKVLFNKKEKRIYIGIIHIINNVKYCIPLSSPKEKHKKMKNSIDFLKINGGYDGAINFNNMIPVLESVILNFDIMDEEKEGYRNILFNQVKFIKKNNKEIIEKADKLYKKVTIYKSNYLLKRCVDYRLLEEKSSIYLKREIKK